jgi:hypothetical protein
MNRRIVLAILIAAASVGIAIAIGVYEYHSGYSAGLAATGKLTPAEPSAYWGWPPYYYRHGPFGFFGFVFPILFFVLIFALIRRMFWGGWGWRRPYGSWRRVPPPVFDEWHRQAHQAMSENRSWRSSAAGRLPHVFAPIAYSVAKASVELLTQDVAAQAGPYNIRANCIAPETILTERNKQRIPEE